MNRARAIGAAALVVYVASIVAANYAITHGLPFGLSSPTPFGTYTVPVWPLPYLVAPAGTYVVALSWPARDVVQRSLGRLAGFAAIAVAAVLSYWISSPAIAIASGGTFAISEGLDAALYTPLQRRFFVWAVVVSSVVAAVVDSLIFLAWSGIGYGNGQLAGLIVGKLWIIALIGAPAAYALRRQLPLDEGLLPA